MNNGVNRSTLEGKDIIYELLSISYFAKRILEEHRVPQAER